MLQITKVKALCSDNNIITRQNILDTVCPIQSKLKESERDEYCKL